jgi:predicted dehydrogenase
LGAARVNNQALFRPASEVPEVEIAGLAARDRAKAEAMARRFGIVKVFDSYDAILADDSIDAVYIPLPNSLHATWSIRAMQAGKHVLCEKPIACNEAEARQMADVSRQTGRLIVEAMHVRYHAMSDRLREIMASGVVGDVRHIETAACFIIGNKNDIRWQYEMGGGALMDLGVYAVSTMRLLAGEEPTVTQCTIKVGTPRCDRWMEAQLAFPSGATGRLLTSMWGWPLLKGDCAVRGSKADLKILDPSGQLINRIEIIEGGRVRRETVPKKPSTYVAQLRAFARAVLYGEPVRTGPDHFIPNMRLIDELYHKGGLPPRGEKV